VPASDGAADLDRTSSLVEVLDACLMQPQSPLPYAPYRAFALPPVAIRRGCGAVRHQPPMTLRLGFEVGF
jgi:hypothetical protein